MTFRDLLPGQRFMFVVHPMRWGSSGPWEKVGLGKYIHAYHGYAIGWGAFCTNPNARVQAVKGEAA